MKKGSVKEGVNVYIKTIVIIVIAVLIFIVAYNLYNESTYVNIGNIRFEPPDGWTVTYPSGYLVECIGPEKDGSQPNFNIIKGNTYSFNSLVDESVDSLEAMGVEILYGPRTTTVYISEQSKEVLYKLYLEEKGYYARGIQTYVDLGDGDYLICTFSAKDGYHYQNEDYYYWALNSMEYIK